MADIGFMATYLFIMLLYAAIVYYFEHELEGTMFLTIPVFGVFAMIAVSVANGALGLTNCEAAHRTSCEYVGHVPTPAYEQIKDQLEVNNEALRNTD